MDDRDPELESAEFHDEPAELSAKEKLRVAEDKLLGEDVSRHDGKPEKGAGSKYAALHPAHKAHLAAIEHLIAVEAEHAEAEARLTAVHTKVEHALERVDATEKTSDEESAKAEEAK